MSKRRHREDLSSQHGEEPIASTSQAANPVSVVGKIKSVYCKDFVTYRECTFLPTEYLNVIIGPNGTGKSTLVAAIVLALGGEPKLLSRSSAIRDYVKNGCTQATIAVEIYANDEGKVVNFERTFDKNGKSEFKVNNRTLSKVRFLEEVAVFRIQINNLCQFLPQDRVQDFAKMNPQEIFHNTVSSVCSQDINNKFERLRVLGNCQAREKSNISKRMKKLEELMSRRDKLSEARDQYNLQQEVMDKMSACNAKKCKLETEELTQQLKECIKDFKIAQQTLAEHKRVYDEMLKQKGYIELNTKKLTEEAREKESVTNALLRKEAQIVSDIEELKNKIRQAKTNYERKKRDKVERDKELENEKRMLEVLSQDLRNAKSSVGSHAENIKRLQELVAQSECKKKELMELVKKRSEINRKIDEDSPEVEAIKRQIDRLKNVIEQKRQYLKNHFPDVFTAVEWLRVHKKMFEGKIYDPMILELNIPDPNNAKYLENTIPIRDLLAFTCENKSDVSKLSDELCVNQNLKINILHSPPARECNYQAKVPIERLRKYGFTAYLIDLVEGPPAILNYLCQLYKLQAIPIGTEDVNKNTDHINQQENLRLYFGGDFRYSVTVSRYSNEKSLMQSHIKSRQLLSSTDAAEIEKLEERRRKLLRQTDNLKNMRTSIEAKHNEVEIQRKQIFADKRIIEEKLENVRDCEKQYERQKKKILNLEQDTICLQEVEQTYSSVVQKCLQDMKQKGVQQISALKSYGEAMSLMKFAQTKMRIFMQENEILINTISEAKERKTKAETMIDKIGNTMESLKKKISLMKIETKNAMDACKAKEVLHLLPDNLEELKDHMNRYSAHLECMGSVNNQVIAEFEEISAEIQEHKKSMEGGALEMKKQEDEIKALHAIWYPNIAQYIDILNQQFGEFMISMGYVGEVVLKRESDYNYDSYGIEILVQYRKNVPLQTLDRHTQSGGERAVAIAVYTLSLQHLTYVPFRCVDEINQGMDSRNERKIFEMLLEETTKEGRSQYFFVTPKLLPNLQSNPKMSIHIVFNGNFMKSTNAFTFQL